jgi:MULE transposase domain/SWIM zinc finger
MIHCKPIIMLDACHIKNSFSGCVFAASSVDGEGAIVNIAFGLASVENLENWEWFLLHLKRAIPFLSEHRLCAISDRAKGLIQAVSCQFPNWEHCFCVKHIEGNIQNSNRYPPDLKEALWKAARTLSRTVFATAMAQIEKDHPRVHEYLNAIDRTTWTTCYAQVPKFNQTTSNVAESFNSWIGSERFRPHLHIMMGISRKMMKLFHRKNLEYSVSLSNAAVYTSTTMTKLSENIDAGRALEVIPSSTTVFLVKSLNSEAEEHKVNLEEKTCTCLYFQQRQFPCRHATAAIRECGDLSIHDFVHQCYKLQSLRTLYERAIEPVLQNELQSNHVKPPVVKKQPGRPRKHRFRSRGERGPGKRCSNCGIVGHHNKRTCERRQRDALGRQLENETQAQNVDLPVDLPVLRHGESQGTILTFEEAFPIQLENDSMSI